MWHHPFILGLFNLCWDNFLDFVFYKKHAQRAPFPGMAYGQNKKKLVTYSSLKGEKFKGWRAYPDPKFFVEKWCMSFKGYDNLW